MNERFIPNQEVAPLKEGGYFWMVEASFMLIVLTVLAANHSSNSVQLNGRFLYSTESESRSDVVCTDAETVKNRDCRVAENFPLNSFSV